jgi:hypothetical protein
MSVDPGGPPFANISVLARCPVVMNAIVAA